jgi:hypothetical protein
MDNVSARQIKFVCSGRVMSSASVALGNHRVELWDAEQVCPDLIACAYTDSSGRFTASLEPAYLATHFLDRDPVLSFKIFNGSAQLVTPHQVWRASATPATLRFVMADALVGREEPRQFVVRGQVTDGRGPLAGLRVEAFNKNLRDEEPLRDDYETLPILTDDNGDYVIQYDGGNIGAENKKNADLFLKVYDEEDAVIATTEVYCHAPPAVTVDIVVGAGTYVGPSVYERLSAALTPMLGSYAWDELTEEEASYLACRGTEDEEVVQALRKAHALALAIDVEPNITFALLRRGLPETRRDLLRMAPSAWRRELVAASAANLIVPMDETALDAAVTSLRVAAAALAFETPDAGTTCNFSDILEVALPTLGDRQTFVDEYIAHEGTIEELWTHVGTLSGFDAPTIARTQLALQWGALTRYHLPLVKQLEVMRATTHPTLKDLAKLSESDWAALLELEIDEVPIGAPADVPGADETARRATYAKVLVRTMETAFPTAAFTERLRIDVGDTDERYLFLVANPTFELGKTRAGSFFATADFGALDMEAVKADLLAVERLFKIAPRYEDMSVLLNDEIRSAGAVHRMGETRFLAKYSEALGLESAKKVFRKACYVSAASTFLMAKYGAAFHALGATTSERPPIHVLPDLASSLSDPPVDVADWVTLFGSPDVCACEDCQSVTSPAAYLVDLLEFLAGIESTVTRLDDSKLSGAEVLLGDGTVPGRRPDIARLALSCANTNVALPYIDLVNELLELRIAEETVATTIDTTRTAAELLAMPEDLFPEARTAAYAAAAGAVHPWTLPFDFFGEEARVYLDHMGVPRDALMTLFQQPTGSAEEGPLPSAATLARERLRLAPVDYELITTGTTAGATPEGLWGRSGAGWEAALLSVPTFLGASGLSYDELLELIDTTLLSELASGTPSIDADGDPCVLTNLTIGGLGSSLADIWDVVHRFLRLRTRLGCSISELDKIVYAFIFGASSPPTSVAEIASAFDDGLLTRIADLRRLVSALRLPIDEALSYWAPMDRHAVPSTKAISLYERVFLSRATQNLAVDDPFVDPSSGTLQDHRDRILSALGISATDFVLLTDAATAARELTLPPAVDSAFNVANLSHLYRIVSFTRALRMPLADFLVLRGLAGFDPLLGASPAQPQDTLNFVEITAKIRSAKVNIAELHYLLRHVTRPTSGVAAEDVLRDQRLAALDAKLQKVAELRAVPVDPSGRVLVGLLETVLGTAEPDSTDIHATAQALLDICLELSALSYAEKQTLLDTSLSDVLGDAFDDVIATLLGDVTGTPPPTLTVPEERVDYLQGVLHDFLLRLDAVTTVKEHLTETFAVPAETVAGLIEGSAAEASWLLAFSDPTAGLLEDFLLPAAGDPPTPPDEKTKAMTLFSKAARVIHWVCPNDATAFDVATLFGASRNTAWLDLAASRTRRL